MPKSYDFSRIDQVIGKAILEEAFTSANVLVGRGERILYRRAFGKLSIDENAPPTTEHTRYDLASLTKPLVVGMLSLRAIETGKLCLWDRLGTFIDAPKDKENITISQLLTHTAGFSKGLHLWKHARTQEESTEVLLSEPLTYPLGTRVSYCCAGYILLAQLLECLYDVPLSDLAYQQIFKPLKMRNTSYLPIGSNIAATEMQDSGFCLSGVVHDENARFLGGVSGNAGVFSTMDDLAIFTQMLCSGGITADGSRYLSKATIDLATRNHTLALNQWRGLGFHLPHGENGYIGDLFPKESFGHTGFTGTSFTCDPTTGLYLIFLTNRICPSRDNLQIYRIRRLLHNVVYAAAINERSNPCKP